MSGTKASVLAAAVAAFGLLALGGCAQLSQAPDSDYRQALEKALTAGQCDGDAVRDLWSAYGRWYGVAASIAGHPMTDEAAVLLRQGDQFRILNCTEVARASYQTLIRRFPADRFSPLRDAAQASLRTLPAPPPVAGGPIPVMPSQPRPPAGI
ncbi:hypothetical protein TSH100_27370 [Azospirillum sp. TSH100]|uniref:hypothetical protein n=1 Tax=Azospirillum sp. TSH100 TaxID=652764 RepID=UPI000D6152E6|nr:hypothetical protein [Azospirillum sp. TSH100]PWC81290.1 hypothetical protein TSH100_27370 [Azospirillum sp. TSH100]QCG91719.1 hypothetical protein E6C72_28320 [Azospirillum sp. TSH100]